MEELGSGVSGVWVEVSVSRSLYAPFLMHPNPVTAKAFP